jgi:hypothetical protein
MQVLQGRLSPAGEYSGLCGSRWPNTAAGTARTGLRASAFSAAPGQRLLTPALISSLFPHLAPRSRRVFLMGPDAC